MAQGRSTKIITMIKWIRTIRLSIKNSLSLGTRANGGKEFCDALHHYSSDIGSVPLLSNLQNELIKFVLT